MITFVYAYYDNPRMLAEQYKLWASYPTSLKREIEIIVVDDASPKSPAIKVKRPMSLPTLRMYRVKKNIAWHQDGARNLGASKATKPWLFLCDMDHMLPPKSLEYLINRVKTASPLMTYFTFGRVEVDGTPTLDHNGKHKPGRNILAMSKALFLKSGGYDEDYCGYYGTDGMFLKRVEEHAMPYYLGFSCSVIRVSTATISDCNTRDFPRKGNANNLIKERIARRKQKLGRMNHVAFCEFEWEEQL